MFIDTIKQIDHELEWISYELTRQSTTGEQEKLLKTRRTALKIIRVLCQDYQNGQYLSRPQFETEATPTQSNEQMPYKAASDDQPSSCLVKSRQPLSQIDIPHREYHIQVRKDNTLYWALFDVTIPPTPKGKPDMKQLELEMLAHSTLRKR